MRNMLAIHFFDFLSFKKEKNIYRFVVFLIKLNFHPFLCIVILYWEVKGVIFNVVLCGSRLCHLFPCFINTDQSINQSQGYTFPAENFKHFAHFLKIKMGRFEKMYFYILWRIDYRFIKRQVVIVECTNFRADFLYIL